MHITSLANTHGHRFSLIRAFAISIVIHVLLLWPAATAWREAVPAVPMVATLLRPSAPPVVPAQAAVAPILTHTRPRPTPVKPLAVAAEEPAVSRNTDTVNETASAATGSEPEAVPSTSDPHPAVASAVPPSPGVDAEGLRGFRLALAREVRRYKRYPTHADQARWEGTVMLRVSVTPTSVPLVQLVKTSGYPELDDAALEMLRRALPTTTIPASLRERVFSVELPIIFELPQ